MVTLRLTQNSTEQADRFHVEIALEGLGPRRTAAARVAPIITENDQTRIRWYLEDYLERSAAPAPTIAASIERRMSEIGRGLFQAVFEANRDTIRLWNDVGDRLGDTRIEISTGVREANAIPWELLRDPRTDAPLALTAAEFVRVQSQAAREPRLPQIQSGGPVRVLLVICRPGGRDDVPFRSVANQLVKGLTDAGDEGVRLDVLRPPSFDELGRVLRRAKDSRQPYHIVHFDGHGLYVDRAQLDALKEQLVFNPNMLEIAGTGAHGYLCFEDATRPNRMRPVDGATLGNLLYETEVPVLVLNACRSALGETSPAADQAAADKVVPELEDQVRVYGSLAQAVVDAGVAGVVAMRYNVYVATAAQFVGELYQVMAEGYSLGRAVTRARKHLSDMPDRAVVGAPIPLQDWLVPTVHEAGPIRLFPERTTAGPLFSLGEHWRSKSEDSNKNELPPLPDAGFFGRDETLLALDRAFDRHKIVLMHAYAGSGKTATAAEFARWYRRTGGIQGPVLFDSFERYRPLARLLDKIGTLFGPILESNRIQWLALDERQRRTLALAILKQFPVFWIWDNVEPVTGFPSGSDSMWSAEEQQELADFLRALRDTKAKMLLTSRRDEQGWLDSLPARIRVPPMPTRERRQLAEALILRRGRDVRLLGVLDPLLSFSQGNPLTLSALVGQALKNGFDNSADIEGFVAKLRAGEAVFDDDVEQGRSKSLGSSLSYGFEYAFNEDERKRLAVLQLFQGAVNPAVLRVMGDRENPDRYENFVGLSREYWVGLLNRAVEIGLLTSAGTKIYIVHPALPWFFRGLFEKYYPDAGGEELPAMRVTLAFAEAIVVWSEFLERELGGTRGLTATLNAEEENLLQALRLARRYGWWKLAVRASNVICNFYGDTGRQVERIRLLRAIVADCLDVETLTSLKGREECWLEAISRGLQLGLLEHDFAAAERFYSAASKHLLARIGDAISRQTSTVSEAERDLIKEYIDLTRIWIGGMVASKVRANLVGAATLGERAFDLACRFDYHEKASQVAFHLGHCYLDIPGEGSVLTEESNLLAAEKWYERALNWTKAENAQTRSMILFELAQTRYRRMQNAVRARAEAATIESLINDALQAALGAERNVAPEFLEGRARVHHLLGNIFDDAGSLTRDRKYTNEAVNHYQEYIKLADRMGDLLDAAVGCREMARLRVKLGEFDDALVFAQEAVRKCEKVGPGGQVGLDRSRELLRDIIALKERSMGAGS